MTDQQITECLTQRWAPAHTKETFETSVDLIDAPDITWRRKDKNRPGRGRPYKIRFGFIRYDGGPWLSDVTIYALRPEAICGDWFGPDKVIGPPQWLTDIIADATPGN